MAGEGEMIFVLASARPECNAKGWVADCRLPIGLLSRYIYPLRGPIPSLYHNTDGNMSSISFPNGGQIQFPGSASASAHEMEFFSSFEASADSTFQMNPLSARPPRTSRVSIGSTTYTYDSDFQTSLEQTPKAVEVEAEVQSDDESEQAREDETSGVRKEEIWRELLLTANGRDKTFKLMQYSLRMYLLFHSSVTRGPISRGMKRPPWEASLFKRFETAISGFSLTRKCLIMFNWLSPLNSILAENSLDPYTGKPLKAKSKPLLHTFLHTSPPVLLELVNAISDDVSSFSKLGLVGRKTGERFGQFADWCWFVSTLVNLVENSVERGVILDQQHQVESRLYDESMTGATSKSNPSAQKVDHKELERLQRKDYWIVVTRMKLLMDLIYVSYNVFRLKRAKSSVQTFTGLASAVLSTAKLYDRHKTSLVKSLRH